MESACQPFRVNWQDQSGNIAVGQPVSQSSVIQGRGASQAVDGFTSASSYTYTALDTNAWWRLDLDSPATVKSVVIFNILDNSCCTGCTVRACQQRLVPFTVTALTADGSTLASQTFASVQATYNWMPTGAIPLNNVDHIVISAPGRQTYLHLSEVQVYGYFEAPLDALTNVTMCTLVNGVPSVMALGSEGGWQHCQIEWTAGANMTVALTRGSQTSLADGCNPDIYLRAGVVSTSSKYYSRQLAAFYYGAVSTQTVTLGRSTYWWAPPADYGTWFVSVYVPPLKLATSTCRVSALVSFTPPTPTLVDFRYELTAGPSTDTKIFDDGFGSADYPGSLTGRYLMVSDANSIITLQFSSFCTERLGHAWKDRVCLYDGNSTQARSLGCVSGCDAHPVGSDTSLVSSLVGVVGSDGHFNSSVYVRSSSNALLLTFTSDANNEMAGWLVQAEQQVMNLTQRCVQWYNTSDPYFSWVNVPAGTQFRNTPYAITYSGTCNGAGTHPCSVLVTSGDYYSVQSCFGGSCNAGACQDQPALTISSPVPQQAVLRPQNSAVYSLQVRYNVDYFDVPPNYVYLRVDSSPFREAMVQTLSAKAGSFLADLLPGLHDVTVQLREYRDSTVMRVSKSVEVTVLTPFVTISHPMPGTAFNHSRLEPVAIDVVFNVGNATISAEVAPAGVYVQVLVDSTTVAQRFNVSAGTLTFPPKLVVSGLAPRSTNYLLTVQVRQLDPATLVDTLIAWADVDVGVVPVVVPGCTYPLADNFDPLANSNTVPCTIPAIVGCSDPTAANYNRTAEVAGRGTSEACTPRHATLGWPCCIPRPLNPNYNLNPIPGCTNPTAFNYNSNANQDDGSCVYIVPIFGCTDPSAINFDILANRDNGMCVQRVLGCTAPAALNFKPTANVDDGSCVAKNFGCMNPLDDAYNAAANVHQASFCTGSIGCTDPLASNFDPRATIDDGQQCIPPFGCTASYVTMEEIGNRFVGRVIVAVRNTPATLYNWTLEHRLSNDSFIEQASDLNVAHRRSYLPLSQSALTLRQFLIYTDLADRVNLDRHLENYVSDSARDDGSFCVPCSPPNADANVDGLVRSLTLRFNGDVDAEIKVVHPRSGRVLFANHVHAGHTFTFNQTSYVGAPDTASLVTSDPDTAASVVTLTSVVQAVFLIGPEVQVFVDDRLDVTIPTACQSPIGPGSAFGSFTVVRGATVSYGDLCSVRDIYPHDTSAPSGTFVAVTPTRDCQEIGTSGSFEYLFIGRRINGATVTTATDFVLNGKRCGATTYCALDCNGRGSCRDTACVCDPGYSGEACEVDCTSPCNGVGTVCDVRNPGICVCADGFTGAQCEYSCRGVCNNQGTLCNATAWTAAASAQLHRLTGLSDSTAVSPCLCDDGFYGPRCEFDCHASCGGVARGTLCNPSNLGECVCNSPYTGFQCEHFLCDEVDDCSGHGSCTGNNTCTCNTNWSGPSCSNWTSPSVRPGRVFDGPAELVDIDFQTHLTVCGSWEHFQSPLSNSAAGFSAPSLAIDRYQWAIGDNSTHLPDSILAWQDVSRLTTTACTTLTRAQIGSGSPALVITFNVRAIQSLATFGRPLSLAGTDASVPSAVASSNGIQIDLSPPVSSDSTVRILHALTNEDSAFQIAGELDVQFATCSDPDTPVVDVQVAVGTNPLRDDVLPWFSLRPPMVALVTSSFLAAPVSVAVTETRGLMTAPYARFRGAQAPSVGAAQLHLPFSVSTESNIYVSVRCINAAGLNSTRTSQRVIIDKRRPNFGPIMDGFGISPDNSRRDTDFQFDQTAVWASWGNVVDSNGAVRRLQWSLGTSSFATDVKAWSDLSLSQLRTLASEFPTALSARNLALSEQRYYIGLRATDAAGLTRTVSTNGFNVRSDPDHCDSILPTSIYADGAIAADFVVTDATGNGVTMADATTFMGASGSSISFVPYNHSLIISVSGNKAFPNPMLHDAIEFHVHTGVNATGGQMLQFTAVVDGKFAGVWPLADMLVADGLNGRLANGSWTRVVVPFEKLGYRVLNEPVTYPRARSLTFAIEGINQGADGATGVNSQRVYLDELRYVRSSCYGCDNVAYSGKVLDSCGRCSDLGSTCCGHGGVTPKRVFDDTLLGDFSLPFTGAVAISPAFARHGATSLKFSPTSDVVAIQARRSTVDPTQSHYAVYYLGLTSVDSTLASNTSIGGTVKPAAQKPADCAVCSGGVTQLSFVINSPDAFGLQNVLIRSMDDSVTFLNYVGTIVPNQNFTASAGLRTDMTTARRAIDDSALQVFGTSVKIYVGLTSGPGGTTVPKYHATLNTNCLSPVGPGLKVGFLQITGGYSLFGGKLCPLACSTCAGGVSYLRLRYTGSAALSDVAVRAQAYLKDGTNHNLYRASVSQGQVIEIVTDNPAKSLGSMIWICDCTAVGCDSTPGSCLFNNDADFSTHTFGGRREWNLDTTCTAKVGPGFQVPLNPLFEVVDAFSTAGGETCENTCSPCGGAISRVSFRFTNPTTQTVKFAQGETNLRVFRMDTGAEQPGPFVPLAFNTDYYVLASPSAGNIIQATLQGSGLVVWRLFGADCSSSSIAPAAEPLLEGYTEDLRTTQGNFRLLDPIFSTEGGRVCPRPTGQCVVGQGIDKLVLKYLGAGPTNLQFQQTGQTVPFAAVNANSEILLYTYVHGNVAAFGGSIVLTSSLEGRTTTIHTDCSRAIGVGTVFDSLYEVVGGAFHNGGPIGPLTCSPCRGGLSSLELRFKGTNPTWINVYDTFNGEQVFGSMVDPSTNMGKFSVHPGGGKATFNASLVVDAAHFGIVKIDTTCSTAIGVDLDLGIFEISGGESYHAGPLCRMHCDTWTGCTGTRSVQFKYVGANNADIRVFGGAQARSDFGTVEQTSQSLLVNMNNVAPGTPFTVTPLRNEQTLGSLLTLTVDGVRHADVVVDCTHAIGPHYRPGTAFEVMSVTNNAGLPLCDVAGDDCLAAGTCGECVGAVTRLRLKYVGRTLGNASAPADIYNSAMVEIFQQSSPYENNREVFSGRLKENEEFALVALPGETLERSLMVFVNGERHVVIDTGCVHKFGIGMQRGDFVVTDGFSSAGGVLGPYVCDECKGGINRLLFQYEGTESPVRVIVMRHSFSQNADTGIAFNDTIRTGDLVHLHAGPDLANVFGESVQLYVDGHLHATIFTDCTRLIGPGARTDDFVLLEAASMTGGLLCPPEDECLLFNPVPVAPTAAFSPTLYNEIQFYLRGASPAAVRENATDLRLRLVGRDGLALGEGVFVDDFMDRSAVATADDWTKVVVPFSALLTESYFMLQNKGSGRCLSAQQVNRVGDHVQQFKCDHANTYQRWVWEHGDPLATYAMLLNVGTGKCASRSGVESLYDAQGPNKNIPIWIVIAECNPNDSRQRFRWYNDLIINSDWHVSITVDSSDSTAVNKDGTAMVLESVIKSTAKWTYYTDVTYGGTANGLPCVFPFTYKGVVYTQCTNVDNHRDWCYTDPDYASRRRWGFCLAQFQTSDDSLVAGISLQAEAPSSLVGPYTNAHPDIYLDDVAFVNRQCDGAESSLNIAYHKPTTCSSFYGPQYECDMIVDGIKTNYSRRWASAVSPTFSAEWVAVDLEFDHRVSLVRIYWAAPATTFSVQLLARSDQASSSSELVWTTVDSRTENTAFVTYHQLPTAVTAQQVRIAMDGSSGQGIFSIYEVEVEGENIRAMIASSQCAFAFGGSCYSLSGSQIATKPQARTLCAAQGGALAVLAGEELLHVNRLFGTTPQYWVESWDGSGDVNMPYTYTQNGADGIPITSTILVLQCASRNLTATTLNQCAGTRFPFMCKIPIDVQSFVAGYSSSKMCSSDNCPASPFNAAPAIHAAPDVYVNEGFEFKLPVWFTDRDSSEFFALVDWDDQSAERVEVPASGALGFTLVHSYTHPGVYRATISLADDQGGMSTVSVRVHVYNVAPRVNAPQTVNCYENSLCSFAVPFADDGSGDSHSFFVVWEDDLGLDAAIDPARIFATSESGATMYDGGSPTSSSFVPPHTQSYHTNGGTNQVTISHTYSDAGVPRTGRVRITVTDSQGANATQTVQVRIGTSRLQTLVSFAEQVKAVVNGTNGANLTFAFLTSYGGPELARFVATHLNWVQDSTLQLVNVTMTTMDATFPRSPRVALNGRARWIKEMGFLTPVDVSINFFGLREPYTTNEIAVVIAVPATVAQTELSVDGVTYLAVQRAWRPDFSFPNTTVFTSWLGSFDFAANTSMLVSSISLTSQSAQVLFGDSLHRVLESAPTPATSVGSADLYAKVVGSTVASTSSMFGQAVTSEIILQGVNLIGSATFNGRVVGFDSFAKLLASIPQQALNASVTPFATALPIWGGFMLDRGYALGQKPPLNATFGQVVSASFHINTLSPIDLFSEDAPQLSGPLVSGNVVVDIRDLSANPFASSFTPNRASVVFLSFLLSIYPQYFSPATAVVENARYVVERNGHGTALLSGFVVEPTSWPAYNRDWMRLSQLMISASLATSNLERLGSIRMDGIVEVDTPWEPVASSSKVPVVVVSKLNSVLYRNSAGKVVNVTRKLETALRTTPALPLRVTSMGNLTSFLWYGNPLSAPSRARVELDQRSQRGVDFAIATADFPDLGLSEGITLASAGTLQGWLRDELVGFGESLNLASAIPYNATLRFPLFSRTLGDNRTLWLTLVPTAYNLIEGGAFRVHSATVLVSFSHTTGTPLPRFQYIADTGMQISGNSWANRIRLIMKATWSTGEPITLSGSSASAWRPFAEPWILLDNLQVRIAIGAGCFGYAGTLEACAAALQPTYARLFNLEGTYRLTIGEDLPVVLPVDIKVSRNPVTLGLDALILPRLPLLQDANSVFRRIVRSILADRVSLEASAFDDVLNAVYISGPSVVVPPGVLDLVNAKAALPGAGGVLPEPALADPYLEYPTPIVPDLSNAFMTASMQPYVYLLLSSSTIAKGTNVFQRGITVFDRVVLQDPLVSDYLAYLPNNALAAPATATVLLHVPFTRFATSTSPTSVILNATSASKAVLEISVGSTTATSQPILKVRSAETSLEVWQMASTVVVRGSACPIYKFNCSRAVYVSSVSSPDYDSTIPGMHVEVLREDPLELFIEDCRTLPCVTQRRSFDCAPCPAGFTGSATTGCISSLNPVCNPSNCHNGTWDANAMSCVCSTGWMHADRRTPCSVCDLGFYPEVPGQTHGVSGASNYCGTFCDATTCNGVCDKMGICRSCGPNGFWNGTLHGERGVQFDSFNCSCIESRANGPDGPCTMCSADFYPKTANDPAGGILNLTASVYCSVFCSPLNCNGSCALNGTCLPPSNATVVSPFSLFWDSLDIVTQCSDAADNIIGLYDAVNSGPRPFSRSDLVNNCYNTPGYDAWNMQFRYCAHNSTSYPDYETYTLDPPSATATKFYQCMVAAQAYLDAEQAKVSKTASIQSVMSVASAQYEASTSSVAAAAATPT
ncbi:hypothetical protein CAOG_01926 [Capsaspora owczarzaki ATCC 30864]|uniref:EGF-like domain-containing protein n=1 Tax=Capsaspora owczarzaki (strain ATCC 30864) TaxID=595528 RepID=A0A0D2X1E1_CAPO3|nr:hypothetical protein CAOG_01926 [Capsaspora owczarzaki ATCC 30864]KJE90649.1 hypothetical protein CAOG_001926 [Capsaspora owczarzaki ATCC 30864]|eukprot:XP_004364794.2 hypothetical protein CAOG_01926 [Capsaspora owczarzaki ATCC 30864]